MYYAKLCPWEKREIPTLYLEPTSERDIDTWKFNFTITFREIIWLPIFGGILLLPCAYALYTTNIMGWVRGNRAITTENTHTNLGTHAKKKPLRSKHDTPYKRTFIRRTRTLLDIYLVRYLQHTFSIIDVCFVPFLTSSLVARQTSVFSLSCLVGVKCNVDVVILPSADT